jgi:3-deoxy-manno-octulosonate cytidylyltransferase (CMP-KDO synthetase)
MSPNFPQSNTFAGDVPVCIPARWAAKRLPGKLLAVMPDGRTVLQTTVDIARLAGCGPVIVLAADERIERAADRLGVEVRRSIDPARNGSERIAEALRRGWLGVPMPGRVLNLQGDAVGARPEFLKAALAALDACPHAALGTVAVPLGTENPDGRTTVRRDGLLAVDFSRRALTNPEGLLAHVGIYAYRSAALLDVAALEPRAREVEESLEQLRWLETGRTIALSVVQAPSLTAHAIDVAGDLQPTL